MSKEPTGLDADFFVSPEERDPVKAAREPARPLPKRFYKEAIAAPAEGGYGIFLDGRPVNTPARRPLVAPSQPLAEAIAAEWAKQGETIDPATMPLTKLMNTALDGVAAQMAEVEADVAKYAASDLICYRAGEPASLAAAQSAAWDPLARLRPREARRQARARRGRDVHRPAAGGARRVCAPSAPMWQGGRAAPARRAARHDDAHRIRGSCACSRRHEIGRGQGLGGRQCRRGLPDAHLGRRRRSDGPSVRALSGVRGGGDYCAPFHS